VTGTQIKEGTLGPVPGAIHADNATRADHATNAANATDAANAQPIAFAHVSAAGVLDVANSKNVGSVFRLTEGVYCFSGLPFTPRGGQAIVDAFSNGGSSR
jgi:hypothetical protein